MFRERVQTYLRLLAPESNKRMVFRTRSLKWVLVPSGSGLPTTAQRFALGKFSTYQQKCRVSRADPDLCSSTHLTKCWAK